MSFVLDPEVHEALAPLLAMTEGVEPPPPGDWKTRRVATEQLMVMLADLHPAPQDVRTSDHDTTAADGAAVRMRWYAKEGSSPGSAVMYLHGDGMIFGSVDLYDDVVRRYVSASGVPMLSVDYRLAPEHPHPTPVEHCYAAPGVAGRPRGGPGCGGGPHRRHG